MNLGLDEKTAIVLASSRGIGKGIAKGLAEEGANVIIASRDEEVLQKVAAEMNKETKGLVKYKTCDMANADSIKSLVQFTINEFGSIDILVNNTGGPPKGVFTDFDDEDWMKAHELTFLSYVRAIREVLPYMEKNGGGRILNNTSSSIKQAIDGLLLSNVYRNAIMGLTKTLANELAEKNILINTIAPGKIKTDRLENTLSKIAKDKNMSIDEAEQSTIKNIPLGRLGTPEEFAKLAVFLCSEANTYITGQAMLVDGGLVKSIH
ncbi:SDR family oxidoreductase [Oceanobacillus jeddahense]|uniref:SDR family oxidoreductase n=1 Tax=Oceanobacillus jeddahense TaxID=1462527 RepID=UPI000595C1A5|nr:SDR family oxidoreductase [Oceanobacillus jeddahense]